MKKSLAAVLFLLPLSAFAAVPAEVDAALDAAGTDAATVGAAVLVVIVAIFAFKLMRKAL